MARVKYWVWLSCAREVRALMKCRLLEAFGGPDKIYGAAERELSSVPGLRPQELERLLDRDMSETERVLSACAARGISLLTLQDAEYPERLRNIPDPPVVLYVWGRLPAVDEHPTFAIVGTRKASAYGLRMASMLGGELARDGAIVVSGLADGCDSAAMDAALRAGGETVGVLGTAIDVVYPAKNRALFEQVKTRGAIVGEYPPGMRTYPADFKARNRIISGLSLGVVVAEAPVRSGTRVTVDHALAQGRDVFAVPGNADAAASAGCNDLIANGAMVAVCGRDVLDAYGERADLVPYPVQGTTPPPAEPTHIKKEIDKPKDIVYIDLVEEELPPDQRRLMAALVRPGMHTDELIEATGLSAPAALAALTMLEIRGLVTQVGRRYSKKSDKDADVWQRQKASS